MGWGALNVALSCPPWTGIPTQLALGKICTRDMTCDFCAEWSSTQWEAFVRKDLIRKGNVHALQALFPLR